MRARQLGLAIAGLVIVALGLAAAHADAGPDGRAVPRVVAASDAVPAPGAVPGPPLKVVVTIKPIHSLVAALLAGVAEPVLLVDGQASPHAFTLKPSGARAAHEADILVRVSPAVEPFSERLIQTLPASVEVMTLAELPGLHLLKVRTGDTFEAHDHGEAGHGEVAHHEGAHEEPGHAAHEPHDVAHDMALGRVDGHVWLDPDNARRIVAALAAEMSRRAPGHGARIAANAAAVTARMASLQQDMSAELASVRARPFIVFHDAYQYLEQSFGLEARGAITLSPDVQPSARRLSALRHRIAALGPVCVFAEPQFQGGLIAAVIEGTKARSGVLDPEGALLAPGPDLYFTLMHDLAVGIRSCLAALPAR